MFESGFRFRTDAVVTGLDIAANDAHIARPVRVDAVTVGHQRIVQDPYPVEKDIITAQEMHCPEGGVSQRHGFHGDAPAVLEVEHERPAGSRPVPVRLPICHERSAVAINNTAAGNGNVFGTGGMDPLRAVFPIGKHLIGI